MWDIGASLLKRMENGVYKKIANSKWLDESPIIKALTEEEGEIARIYLKSYIPREIRQIRAKALESLR